VDVIGEEGGAVKERVRREEVDVLMQWKSRFQQKTIFFSHVNVMSKAQDYHAFTQTRANSII